ncbi:phosphatidylinositol 3,5-bisphosphate-binding protein [Patellaria atrata CBS 101060]|uniref:Phosphatidylinositol 3,5-bisphosphate-binding protein n=1 Tax=Patellaria atrata CBS 101060 TaxID=1346257 RepID=A0A9P4VVM3_9PEZI|nr:phosphatidylinositol 3,5-bisphosphate-binding protein [Patellaria atrata CBS 101060]
MNTRRVIDESTGPAALSASFNGNNSCFSVALDTGFHIYRSNTCDRFVVRELGAGIGCAEMVGTSNLLALVGGGKQPKFPQNKVVIWDDKKQREVCKMEFRTPVQGVRLSRSHIVVVLHNSVNLYPLSSSPTKIAVFETANNPFGLCSLGEKKFAFPGRTPGQVQLVELSTRNVSIMPAHNTPLRAITISTDGELLATASETGTLIRLYSTANCAKLAEFRRGVDPATIFSLSISPSSSLLAVTSDKSTLHIFELPHPARPASSSPRPEFPHHTSDDSNEHKQKWGILAKIPLMPRVFSDTYSSCSTHFEIGEEPLLQQARARSSSSLAWNAPIPGLPGGLPPKGIAAWVSDEVVLVIGAGQDARWEKFVVGYGEDGKRVVYREGWRRYLED